MSIILIEPGAAPRTVTGPVTIADLQRLLSCEAIERIPGVTDYEGAPADMYGDEMAGLSERAFNLRAVELRDAGLVASGHRPSPNPIQGPVVILTGKDRLP
ncbi:MAG TPA: hypothetical protein P5256_00325 [Beijerinckiaceae bacterium]|nr:hypothetical protein [Rhodoblastus sp.]MCC2107207.1 hypothetical protein [Hyphomicrobiales bacterium]MCO5088652.1 DUF3846 domain-containing protein [Methylobacteriaceae bacterium]HRY01541.1 hypothetical protein [Beijerinckiaceae bacterium]